MNSETDLSLVATATFSTFLNEQGASIAAYFPGQTNTASTALPASYISPMSTSTTGCLASLTPIASVSGKKAGVAYNVGSLVIPFVGKSKIGWAYNWGSSPENIPSGIEYIPLLWGNGPIYTDSWTQDANKAISCGTSAVLGFNEPDHPQQANIDFNTAAMDYKQYITSNFAGKIKLVSPSVTNGAAPMGLAYLQNFMDSCSDCQIGAIAIHWYDTSTNIQYFQSYIRQAYDQFKLPIWLTEFGTTDGNDTSFLEVVLPWLDSQSYVERYAYFMAEDGMLLSGNSLNAAGQIYAGL
ncbi:uncharacterized protein PV09_09387 [Verruconis gallopava]|uniref:Asl1-like glycosyl hydrolase catalytic domain-containing protein n=1 Tax=Verruconis gallopava TaxID=253628 RepID=A0A0D1YDP6_9PEZI|nr:uncharacterized protein PV09_09387 [Verruconis gallopava]KIV98861.1 hypothetical protein PV09_09387 [Verruconis gallopava]